MIRCVRMWTGEDGDSLFEEGWIDLSEGARGDFAGQPVPVVQLSFQETRSGGSYEWHQDPVPRFVITLSGTLEFQTKSGATFTKVYGKASEGSPPMSVPHLDTRIIGGKRSLLFGPYAGFSSKFLKHGSYSDLFRSIEPGNIAPMLAVARDDWRLAEYLIGQVLQTGSHQFKVLEQFYPQAQRKDWREAVAGQRVQIIKPDPARTGVLEFGTELIGSADSSIVALLGASPGASTSAFIAFQVLEKCFKQELAGGWRDRLKTIIPTYGIDLTKDAAACRDTRAKTAKVLRLTNV
jgi:malate dehydrogenase (quinone)